MQSILSIHGLFKRFGGLMALCDVSCEVPRDSILGLIGPNGAGKTTLFNCIAGVCRPSDGDILYHGDSTPVRLNGRKPDRMTRLGIARTFQNIRLFASLTVLDNVRIGRHVRTRGGLFGAVFRTPAQRREERAIIDDALHWLRFVGLEHKAADPAGSLPYGDQRRLEIARALAAEPALLLLDEPAAGMNPAETQSLDELIRRIQAMGVTIVLIEHDMKLVMNLCQQLLVLDHGEKIAEGAPEAIRDNTAVIEAYLGRGAAGA